MKNNNLEKINNKNKTPLCKRLKKILLVLPFMLTIIFVTACGIPKYSYDTNVIFDKSLPLDIIGTIQKSLVNNNPDKSGSSYYDPILQADKDTGKEKSQLLSATFCKDYENPSATDELRNITTPKKIDGRYTYYWQKILGLYVKPDKVDDTFLNTTDVNDWAKAFPAPASPYDHDKLASFNYSAVWKNNDREAFLGVLEVQGANPHFLISGPVYIRFILLFDSESTTKSMDIFVSPYLWWKK